MRVMSRQNVELVRRRFDAFNRGDIAAMMDAGDRVVVGVHLLGRGRSSGVPFEEHEFHVFTLRGGRVTETREYRDRAGALEAAGLSE